MIVRYGWIAALLGGCAVVPPAAEVRTPAEVVQPVATPAPAPAPSTPTPQPTGPSTFLFDGELTQGGWLRGQVPGGTVSARLGEQELALDSEGHFFAAFDRDAGPSAELEATLADGRVIRSPLAVSPRAWQIERINTPPRPGGQSSEAFMRRRQPELDAIWSARTANSPSDGWRQQFIWPATGRISGRFGSQRIYQGEPGSYHSGLDIAPGVGTPFVAPADGVVTLAAAEPYSLEGHLIIIDHGAGLNSAFLHASEIFVTQGQRVRQGERIGLVGASGRATGPHLHWSIKWHLARLDPLLFVGPMP